MSLFFAIIQIFFLFAAAFCLTKLWIIDLRVRLLPNVYVGTFFLCGGFFHFLSGFAFGDLQNLAYGALAGGGLLWLIRAIANRAYGFDTLGLGDVKLMGAAGFWLGLDFIFLALCVGSFAGLVHGIVHGMREQKRTGKKVDFARLSIPAGPGFIVGIAFVGAVKFQDYPATLAQNSAGLF